MTTRPRRSLGAAADSYDNLWNAVTASDDVLPLLFRGGRRESEATKERTERLDGESMRERQQSVGWGGVSRGNAGAGWGGVGFVAPQPTQDLHVLHTEPLLSPRAVKAELPMTAAANATVVESRNAIKAILSGEDPRLLVIVGPCSIHDEHAALEYARRLAPLGAELADVLYLVMRVYFEKPRTTVGWKGLINDPHLDGSFDMHTGLQRARRLLLAVTELGVPAATEMLEPITPQYIADLVSWAAIGARTTESQTHRQLASGLSMPVGFKNGTDGNLNIALDAMQSARNTHGFLGIDEDGRTAIVRTAGNPWGHLILRGGADGPNYAAEHVRAAVEALQGRGLPQAIMVDCSHANSGKKFANQARVWESILEQRAANRDARGAALCGAMLESNLVEGAQKLCGDPANLCYGQSITDECVGWDETTVILRSAQRSAFNK